MKTISLLTVLAAATVLAARAQEITGDWQGTLKPAPGAELHLVLHISKTGDGELRASLDSVDQADTGIPISSITFKGPTLTFASDAVQGKYEGKMSKDGSAIEGEWTQGQPCR